MVPDYIEIFWEFANPFFDVKRMFGILGYKGERMLEDGESLFSFSEI